jgi:putative MFS transporter
MLVLNVKPEQAAFMLIFVNSGGFVGRIVFAWLSEAIGRRASGGLFGLGAAVAVVLAGLFHSAMIGTVSVFWLLLIVVHFLGDGGFSIVGPYSAEVWPSNLRTTGMGSAYGFGGIGKIIGPLGLALIVGSSNVVSPQVTMDAIVPAFFYLAGWYALAGIVYLVLGIETKGRSFEEIETQLAAQARGRGARAKSLPAE